ncbi:uncharacterized protein BXIN_2632 [Babesia sp. Xinjiang]|uniref:uncharacterized protein n=1 Tax=Babesia sp. Xinjiang TaxID=462227 RepID=UPI000A2284DE|nr:uncharacterized protein BXIN_2688 [Babesia sp. Xinjiang]XP_028872114.1 uncharacterized protein BXIN_2632 [Babesia sp. Xinjiang]ORM41622.1 hypothetical protein BXIN_2688 [Babesia sp. Xinjiang]ORM41658.1 hypothetical protein BXIN_2632 [Babesia sp. Xinjiang]
MTETKSSNGTPTVTYGVFAQMLYHILAFMEGYDLQVISVCLRAFEMSLKLSPSSLSTMVTMETMTLLGGAVFWGFLADKCQNQYVLAAGALLTGVTNILLGIASHFKVILVLRFFHGFGLACGSPVQQKIISTSVCKDNHSAKFGIINAMMCLGRLLSAVLTTFSAGQLLIGYHGWRTCYVVFGYIWVLMGVAVLFGMVAGNNGGGNGSTSTNGSANQCLWEALKKPTTIVLIFLVFISDAPFSAFTYMIMYLQYLGVSDLMAGVAVAMTLVGGAVGSAAGGKLISLVSAHNHGLLGSGIVCVIIRLIACLCFFLGSQPRGFLRWQHYLELAVMGASLVTIGSVDRTIMTNTVEDEIQALAWATTRCIAGVSSSLFFYPLAGYLSEKIFGYTTSTQSFAEMSDVVKNTNAEALRKTMMYIMVVGTIVNAILYGLCMITYENNKNGGAAGGSSSSSSSCSK